MNDGIGGARLDAAIRDFHEYEVDFATYMGGYPAEVRELYGIVAVASVSEDGEPELQMFTPMAFVNYVEDLLEERDGWIEEDETEDIYD
jgi:hypothetical protein